MIDPYGFPGFCFLKMLILMFPNIYLYYQHGNRCKTKRFAIYPECDPGSFLILLPDSPHFTIISASDNYLADTYLKRNEAIGKGVFEILTDDPDNQAATGVKISRLHCYTWWRRKRNTAWQSSATTSKTPGPVNGSTGPGGH